MTRPEDTVREAGALQNNVIVAATAMYERIRTLEAERDRLREERDMARASRDQWERTAGGRAQAQYEVLARAEAAEAERDRLRDALANFDPFVVWLNANYPKALREMPRTLYGAIPRARAALDDKDPR